MNFMEAVKEMKEGRQIKRKGGFQLLNLDNKYSVEEIEATDWDFVEANETLSEKVDDFEEMGRFMIFEKVYFKYFGDLNDAHKVGLPDKKFVEELKSEVKDAIQDVFDENVFPLVFDALEFEKKILNRLRL